MYFKLSKKTVETPGAATQSNKLSQAVFRSSHQLLIETQLLRSRVKNSSPHTPQLPNKTTLYSGAFIYSLILFGIVFPCLKKI